MLQKKVNSKAFWACIVWAVILAIALGVALVIDLGLSVNISYYYGEKTEQVINLHGKDYYNKDGIKFYLDGDVQVYEINRPGLTTIRIAPEKKKD